MMQQRIMQRLSSGDWSSFSRSHPENNNHAGVLQYTALQKGRPQKDYTACISADLKEGCLCRVVDFPAS